MSEHDLRERAEQLKDRLVEDVDVSVDDLEEQFRTYREYDVGPDSAANTILRDIAENRGVEVSEIVSGSGGGEVEQVTVDEIDGLDEDTFVTVEAEVSELWDSDSESVAQTGLVHDDTGRTKFTSWSKSDVPVLAEGQAYRLEGVAVDEFQGQKSISLNSRTQVEQLDSGFEEPDMSEEFTGALVSVRPGSGLISRCTEDGCNRVTEQNQCAEHGDVETEFDLRLKCVLDDGHDTQDVIIGRELTERMTGVTLDEAQEMAKQAFDTEVVRSEMMDRILNRYYTVEGWMSDYGLIAEDVVEADTTEQTVEELVERITALDTGDADADHDSEQENLSGV